MRLFADIIFDVHELEDFTRCPQGLLEVVVELGELADWVVQAEDGRNEGYENSRGHVAVLDLFAAQAQQERNSNGAKNIHQRRTDRGRGHGTQVGAEQAARRSAKAGNLPLLAVEGLYDAVAGNGLVQDVLDLGKLVLSMPGSAADTGADLARGINDHGNEQQQHPRQVSAQNHNHGGYRQKSEKLLQKLGQHRGHGVLHPLDVVDDGRKQGSGRVLGEKCCGAAQDCVVKIVAKVSDHAEAGMVHQIRARVVENSLQYGGADQGDRDHVPCIREMRRHQLLQINRMVRNRNGKQLNIFRSGGRIQHAVKDRANQQELERVERSHRSHQQN